MLKNLSEEMDEDSALFVKKKGKYSFFHLFFVVLLAGFLQETQMNETE